MLRPLRSSFKPGRHRGMTFRSQERSVFKKKARRSPLKMIERSDLRAFDFRITKPKFYLSLLYSSSLTDSSHSLEPFSPGTSIARCENQLSAAFIGMMNMPIIAAARLKGHIENPDLLGGNGSKIALSDKEFRKNVVRFTDRKQHLRGVSGFGAVGSGFIILPNILCETEYSPRLGPADIKSRVGDYHGGFRSRYAVSLGVLEMIDKRGVRDPFDNTRFFDF